MVAGATTFPGGKHVTGFSVAYGSLRIQFLCHPRSSVGRQKESALMGRLGALLRPTWRSYAGPPQGHYKAPLCCERLMKRMLRGVLFCPLHRGKSGAARIGGGERSEPVSRIVFMPYDTESQSRNVLASPLGEEGHEVAKGWTVVRMIMTLDMDVTAERRHYNTHRPRGRYHNPRPERPSNLRTLRPSGRSILRTLTPKACPKARVQLPLENFPVFLYNKKKTGVTPLLIEKELL